MYLCVWLTLWQHNVNACAELGFYKPKSVFLLQVASSRTPWSCASHHHVRFQIPCAAVETQTSRNTKKCKMKPCSRCSYEERNIFHFLFLWWIRSSCNHATPCPLSRVLLLPSHISPQVQIMLKGRHIKLTWVFTFLTLSLPSQLLVKEFQDHWKLIIFAEIEGRLYESECCAWWCHLLMGV